MSEYNIHREVQCLTERLYQLERDTRSVLEEKDKRIAKLDAFVDAFDAWDATPALARVEWDELTTARKALEKGK